MSRVKKVTVWQYDELSDAAKERARDWFREGNLDHDWWEFVYDDADTCARLLGIEMHRKERGRSPRIWFSGFASQGDGACFEGHYRYAKGALAAIQQHAPMDKELHRIAAALQALQRRNFYRVTATTAHRGHYYHSGCMTVDVEREDGAAVSEATEEETTQLMRDFADWIYRQLEAEHDYQQADEQVEDSIRANEYEFDEDGRIA